MRRSISRWTMSLATAGVLVLPVSSFARTPQQQAPPQQQQPQQQQPDRPQPQPAQPDPGRPQPTDPQPAQPQQPPAQPQPQQPQPTEPQPTAPPTTTSAAQSPTDQTVSPQEHLRQAQQAVNEISANSVPAKNRAKIAELKRHLSNLEKMGSSPASTPESSTSASKSTGAAKTNWGTEVAAIDKIIGEIAGNDTASTTTPGATGTSGTAKSSSATIDDATRAKLMDVRSHITAYAAGMAGTPSTPKTEAAASSPAASTAQSASSMTTTPTASSQTSSTASSQPSAASPSAQNAPNSPERPQSEPQPSAEGAGQQPSAAGQQSATAGQQPSAAGQQPSTAGQEPSAAAGQQPSAAGQQPMAGQQPSAAGQSMNTEEAHRHLVTARDTLAQMTQLPAAAQLNGDARTQVSQLITNFNELIGNPPDWHASYQKVAGNLTTLLGPDNSDAEAQGGAPTATTGATAAPGAVGTSGTATIELDPALRAKLVEFRRSLSQFEKAAGGTK